MIPLIHWFLTWPSRHKKLLWDPKKHSVAIFCDLRSILWPGAATAQTQRREECQPNLEKTSCDFWKKIKKNPIAKYRTNRIFKGVPGYFGRRNNFQRLVGNIEEDDIEEDDFEKDTNFRSGRHQSHSVLNVKT